MLSIRVEELCSKLGINNENVFDDKDGNERLQERLGQAVVSVDHLYRNLDAKEEECQKLTKDLEQIKLELRDGSEELEAIKSRLEASKVELERECGQLTERLDDLQLKKSELEKSNEELKNELNQVRKEWEKYQARNGEPFAQSSSNVDGELNNEFNEHQSDCDQLVMANDELSNRCEKQQRQIDDIQNELRSAREKIEKLESEKSNEKGVATSTAESTHVKSSSSTEMNASSENVTNNREVESARIQLKAMQLGFLKELEKLKKLVIPNFSPKLSTNLLTLNQRNFLAKIQELEAGKFEVASVAALPHEKTFGARELHVEVSRLEGIVLAQNAQYKLVKVRIGDTHA